MNDKDFDYVTEEQRAVIQRNHDLHMIERRLWASGVESKVRMYKSAMEHLRIALALARKWKLDLVEKQIEERMAKLEKRMGGK